MKSYRYAGQHNLKGKKSKLLSCRCCEVIDFREEYLYKEHMKEIREVQIRMGGPVSRL